MSGTCQIEYIRQWRHKHVGFSVGAAFVRYIFHVMFFSYNYTIKLFNFKRHIGIIILFIFFYVPLKL